MDFDLGQVRAFVVTAEELHFGRAADRLFVSPQALSKRIRRLEECLTVPLFVRSTRSVELAEAGHRFLSSARVLIAAADEASLAARSHLRTLNIDAWSHDRVPWEIAAELAAELPELRIELSARRSLPLAVSALRRGEIDAAFGRVDDLDHPLPAGVVGRPIRLQPFEAVLLESHPLATAAAISPDDFRRHGMWVFSYEAAFARRFGQRFQIPVAYGGTCSSAADFMEHMSANADRITMLVGGLPVPADAGLVVVPIEPTPVCPWSLVWRAGDRHPALHRFLRTVIERSRGRRWLAYDPDRQWMTDRDTDELAAMNV